MIKLEEERGIEKPKEWKEEEKRNVMPYGGTQSKGGRLDE